MKATDLTKTRIQNQAVGNCLGGLASKHHRMSPLPTEPPEVPTSKWVDFIFGGLAGAAYGVVIASFIYYFTRVFPTEIIGVSAGVLAVFGLYQGNLIIEAFLALLHFLWGAAIGASEYGGTVDGPEDSGYLHWFMRLGFVTGLILLIWRCRVLF